MTILILIFLLVPYVAQAKFKHGRDSYPDDVNLSHQFRVFSYFKSYILSLVVLVFISLNFTRICYAKSIVSHDQVKEAIQSLPKPQTQCNVSQLQKLNAKTIVMMFEGHTRYDFDTHVDFNRLIEQRPKCITKTSSEGKKFQQVEAGDLIFNKQDLQNLFYKQAGIKKFYFDYLCSSQTPELDNYKVLYFQEFADCKVVESCLQNVRSSLPNTKIIMMGFSYGGAKALQCAHQLSENGTKIDLGITFDPVPQDISTMIQSNFFRKFLENPLNIAGCNCLGSPDFDSYAPESFVAPMNSKWLNFWQESDNRFLGITGLTGFGVNNADYNRRISITGEAAEHAHWNIMNHGHVKEQVIKALDGIK